MGEHKGARAMLREFEEAAGGVVRDVPTALSNEERDLRASLILEEVGELLCSLAGRDDLARGFKRELLDVYWRSRKSLVPGTVNQAAVAKELADVEVVLHGTAHYAGVDLDAATAEVHRSNMSKLGGPRREDGKLLKGPGYEPPDRDRLLGVPKARCSADDYLRHNYLTRVADERRAADERAEPSLAKAQRALGYHEGCAQLGGVCDCRGRACGAEAAA